MNLQTQLKDVASRRKLDAIKKSYEAGHGKNKNAQVAADQPQDLDAAETIDMLKKEVQTIKD